MALTEAANVGLFAHRGSGQEPMRVWFALFACLAAGSAVDARKSTDGMLVADPRNPSWVMQQGGRHVFISGPGDPEDFLYRGVRRSDGTRDGDQEALIRKMIAHGGNCIYMQIIRSHGGDGEPDHNPFVASDPARGVSPAILDQWEEWFALMDRNGILIYLFLYDDSARVWNTGDRVGQAERDLIRTLVRRFRHHDRLIWVVAEEAEEALSVERCQTIAELIAADDRQGRIIANHHHSGTTFKSWRAGGTLTQYAMQRNLPLAQVHSAALEALAEARGRYGVIYAENTEMQNATHEQARRFMWASAMAGAMPMLFGADIANTPVETLRSFRVQQRFFEATDYYTMSSHDELAFAATKWVLANPGRSSIAYADGKEGPLGLKGLPAGSYDCLWVDCETGRTATLRNVQVSGGETLLNRPGRIGGQCAVWVRLRARAQGGAGRGSLSGTAG